MDVHTAESRIGSVRWFSALVAVVVGCGGAAPEPVAPAPAPTPASKPTGPEPSALLVLKDGLLLRMDMSGATQEVAKLGATTSCELDERFEVIWLMQPGALSAYDLRDGTLHKVATGLDGDEVWAVRAGNEESNSAGNADGMEECSALVLRVAATPKIGGEYIGEGDRELYCGEFDREDFVPNDEVEQAIAAHNETSLVDSAYVASLVEGRATAQALRRRLRRPAHHRGPRPHLGGVLRHARVPGERADPRSRRRDRVWLGDCRRSKGNGSKPVAQLQRG